MLVTGVYTNRSGYREINERICGKEHGKATTYQGGITLFMGAVGNTIYNLIYKDGEELDKTVNSVSNKADKAYFDKEGRVLYALKASREEFQAQLEQAVAFDISTPITE